MNLRLLAILLVVCLTWLPPLLAEERGSLVIIGGALRYNQADVWSRIVALAGGKGARIAVLPVASSEPLVGGSRTVEALNHHGASAFLVPVYADGGESNAASKASDPETAAQVRGATGVYFIGGSQDRITRALGNSAGKRSPLLEAVWDVYRAGGVVAGTSAGAAVMSRMMFAHSASVVHVLRDGLKVGDQLVPGIGFLDPGWFVEQHCLARGRFGRTLVAMHTLDMKHGVGIDENTAVVVERGRAMSVIGYRGAILLDLAEANSQHTARGFELQNARLSYLDRGDAYDLASHELTPAADKRPASDVVLASATAPIAGQAGANSPAADKQPGDYVIADILGRETVVDALARVVDGRCQQAIGLAFDAGEALRGPTQGFEFRFYRGADSRGWLTHVRGDASVTAANVRLDIRPVEIAGPLIKPAADKP